MKGTKFHSQLRHEYKVYRELHKYGHVQGFPLHHHFGPTSSGNLLILDLLGPSLDSLLNQCNGKFSLKTTLQIADQTIIRLESLHSRNLIHRDVKPDNFCLGLNDNEIIYCLDLGLSQLYIDKHTKKHLPYCEYKSLVGTPRYASTHTHKGLRYGRRDDLMSLAFTLIYFLKGSLPWQGIQIANKEEKYQKIAHLKNTIPVEELCSGIPTEFGTFLQYTKDLKFDEKPNYSLLRNMFMDVYVRENFHVMNKNEFWDWEVKTPRPLKRKRNSLETKEKQPFKLASGQNKVKI
jgi:serine/threonine protein kinase